jgi:hypothetical protein
MGRKKNVNIKGANEVIEYTPEQILELQKCMDDPIYFAKTYVRIQHPKLGAIPFELYPYQQRLMKAFRDERYNIVLSARQTGKSITSAIFLLWFACFHSDKNILIASNKEKGAKEMIHRIRYAYENLPYFLKPGVTEDGWNKHSVAFDNGSRIDSTATSEDSGRGSSISLLYLDEFAFVKPGIQEEFWTSILPTLSTGGNCIMSSTPNGDADKFAQLWRESEAGLTADMSEAVDENGEPVDPDELGEEVVAFVPHHVKWDEPPGRDEKFKKQQIALLGELKWRQEYLCEFLSSDALLIDSRVSANLIKLTVPPKYIKNEIIFWDEFKPNTTYLIGVDPSTGSGRDFSVIEIFEFPALRQIGEYRGNSMSSPEVYARLKWVCSMIDQVGSEAFFSVENNGVGEGIIALYMNDENPPDAQFVSEEGAKRYGMVTNNKVKIKACVNFKQVVESHKIQINSKTLITEIKTYVRKRQSYEAQYGSTDDCISAMLIILRLLEEIAAYDQDAFNRLYTYDENDYLDATDEFSEYSEDDNDVLPVSF